MRSMIICRIPFGKYQGEQIKHVEEGRICGTEQEVADRRLMEYDGVYWSELSEDEIPSRNLYTRYGIFWFHRRNDLSLLAEPLLLSQF